MEECEALCTRLVIMVNGEFKCLGSPQHLKTKFGNGYKLAIRLNDEKNTDTLFNFMKEKFPTSINTETHKNLFEYLLPFSSTKLSQIFGTIEKNRDQLNLKDYSVTQTTLDQIFVNFAKGQNEEDFEDESNRVRDDFQVQISGINNISSVNAQPSPDYNNNVDETRRNVDSSPTTSKNRISSDFDKELNERLNKIKQQIREEEDSSKETKDIDKAEQEVPEHAEKDPNQYYDSKYYEDTFP